jgi:hypothetical protein
MYEEREETEKTGMNEQEPSKIQKGEARPVTAGASHEAAKHDWPLQTSEMNSLAENQVKNTAQKMTRRPNEHVTNPVPSAAAKAQAEQGCYQRAALNHLCALSDRTSGDDCCRLSNRKAK